MISYDFGHYCNSIFCRSVLTSKILLKTECYLIS